MIEQIINDNVDELTKLKRNFELVEWLYSIGNGNADMWKYRQELKDKVSVIVGGCGDK